MNRILSRVIGVIVATFYVLPAFAEVKTTVEHIDNGSATAEFKFKKVPAPAKENRRPYSTWPRLLPRAAAAY